MRRGQSRLITEELVDIAQACSDSVGCICVFRQVRNVSPFLLVSVSIRAPRSQRCPRTNNWLYSLLKRARRFTGSLKAALLGVDGESEVPAISLDHCGLESASNFHSSMGSYRRPTYKIHVLWGITLSKGLYVARHAPSFSIQNCLISKYICAVLPLCRGETWLMVTTISNKPRFIPYRKA